MGKPKSSRKGKKAWRSNINTDDIHDFFEKTTKDALSGSAPTENTSTNSLFFLDKSTDSTIKRKIEKARERVLHCESLLQRNPYVQPVPSSKRKLSKKKKKNKHGSLPKVYPENQAAPQGNPNSTSSLFNIWDDKGEGNVKNVKKPKASLIPAVEVDPPGCSYNPSFEAHQDALAVAVAEEMQKIYKDELGPQPVPQTVTGNPVDEDDIYFLDVDAGNEEDAAEEDVGQSGDDLNAQRPAKARRLTRVDLNRRARHKGRLKAEVEAKKLERISKEIDCLPDIINEIDKENEEKLKRNYRRIVARQERLKSAPPRLGKHKFEPAPLQVLLSEEISGSLRKLKGCCTLARERFKSIEKRGLIAPGAKRRRN